MSKYIEFQQVMNYKGKTKRYEVISKRSGGILGLISWYGAWKQYTFQPTSDTIWNNDCLKDIQDFLQALMDERKTKNDKKYPCNDCGKLRSKAEGGTTFTVCDKCWDKKYNKGQYDG